MGREAKKNDNRKTYTPNTLLSEMLIGTEKERKSYHKIPAALVSIPEPRSDVSIMQGASYPEPQYHLLDLDGPEGNRLSYTDRIG
jgi:hypothetical protein